MDGRAPAPGIGKAEAIIAVIRLSSSKLFPFSPPDLRAKFLSPQSGRDRSNHGKSNRNWRLFFRARQPKALSQWYCNHLGVDVVPANYDVSPWRQQAGPTVVVPFPDDTTYLGDGGQQWMINFRVTSLDAMAGQLRARGYLARSGCGKVSPWPLARLYDPEGNASELREPAAAMARPASRRENKYRVCPPHRTPLGWLAPLKKTQNRGLSRGP